MKLIKLKKLNLSSYLMILMKMTIKKKMMMKKRMMIKKKIIKMIFFKKSFFSIFSIFLDKKIFFVWSSKNSDVSS